MKREDIDNDILEEERIFNLKRMPDMIRRMRILHVKDFFEEYTDDVRFAEMSEIIKYLDEQGIPAERKSVRDDILALKEYGMDIELDYGRSWHLKTRQFKYEEIRLIANCIAESKILSEKKSKELIGKLGSLLSKNQRRGLDERVIIDGREKCKNDIALNTLEKVRGAINAERFLDFKYSQYNMEKKQEYTNDGKIYHVFPEYLLFDGNFYYLVADEGKETKIFRVDKMFDVEVKDYFFFADKSSSEIDIAQLTKSLFGMPYGKETEINGKITEVTLLYKKEAMDAVIDQFGEDIKIEIVDNEHFRIKENVIVGPQFYAWIFGFGENAMIEYPLRVAKEMKDMLKERHKAYREGHSARIYYP